jgi:hypothetical protein
MLLFARFGQAEDTAFLRRAKLEEKVLLAMTGEEALSSRRNEWQSCCVSEASLTLS